MKYELLVLDIDGTLTNSKKEVTAKTLDAIVRLQKSGKHVVIASGRPTAGTEAIARELRLDEYGGFVLSYNGGKIVSCKTKEVIFNASLPPEMIKELYEVAVDQKVGIVTYDNSIVIVGNGIDKYNEWEAKINNLTMYEVDDFPEYVNFNVNKCLLTGEPEHMAEVEMLMKEKFGERLNIFRSEPFFVEVMPYKIDKAYGLGVLLEHLGMSKDRMICCGDGFNDVSMIKYAGLGVAMANAQEAVKEVADVTTLSNEEDGVAYVINEFMIGDR